MSANASSGLVLIFFISPKTETQRILRILVFCKAEIPPKTGEKIDLNLAQFVLLKKISFWPTRPEIFPTHAAPVGSNLRTQLPHTSHARGAISSQLQYRKTVR